MRDMAWVSEIGALIGFVFRRLWLLSTYIHVYNVLRCISKYLGLQLLLS